MFVGMSSGHWMSASLVKFDKDLLVMGVNWLQKECTWHDEWQAQKVNKGRRVFIAHIVT